MKFRVTLILLCLLLQGRLAAAQRSTVAGQVVEAATGEPVPFASLFVPHTTLGTTADLEGRFRLVLAAPLPDSLAVSALGFMTQRRALRTPGSAALVFRLAKAQGVALGEVVVRPGENPAFRILREVQRHKAENDRSSLTAADYRSYNRMEVSLSEVPKAMAGRRVVQDLRALTSRHGAAGEGAPLPLFVSEVGSKMYVRYGPPLRRREDLEQRQLRGAGPREGSVVSQLLGSNFQNFDFYPNWQNILGKDFSSPLAANGRLTYDYDLEDSVLVGQDVCYRLRVTPRRVHDLAFSGLLWITKEGYALRRLDVVASEQANLNFVRELRIFQELTPPGQGPGLPQRTRLVVALRPAGKQAALRVRCTTLNTDFQRNVAHPGSFYDQAIVSALPEPTAAGLLPGGRPTQGPAGGYFDQHRPDTLSLGERQTLAVLDSARELPSVRSALDWVDLFINGYRRVGRQGLLEFGPLLSTFAVNNLEGPRLRLGFRTTPRFSRDWVLEPYLAYGFQDRRLKYGLKTSYIAERRHWTVVSTEFRHDVEQAALLDNDFLPDNQLFTAGTRWGRFTEGRPVLRDLFVLGVQRDLFHGFTQTLQLREQHVRYLGSYFGPSPTDGPRRGPGDVMLTELVLESRYAPDENLVQAENRRRAVGLRRWPVFGLRYTLGGRDLLADSRAAYQKINLSVAQSVPVGHLGRLAYRLEGNYTRGRLPAAFLKVPLGNQTPFYNPSAFNLMNYFEFVTDRSVSLRLDHHFEGLGLNAVPGLRALNWRLVATANVLYGALGAQNQRPQLTRPDGTTQYPYPELGRVPYVEAGYGVENIFRFIRVDFLHRLTYRTSADAGSRALPPTNFGVKISAQFRL